jgi:hypothetical protein
MGMWAARVHVRRGHFGGEKVMTKKHKTSLLAAVVIVATAIIVVPSLAEPPVDSGVTSTGPTGDVLQLSTGGDFASPSSLLTGRATVRLLKSYPAFDYWNLDTSAVLDHAGNVQFGVRLWQYDDYTPNYDRFVLNSEGQTIETWLDWYGLGGVPAATDSTGHNIFVKPSSTSQYFGVVDSNDYIYVFNTSAQPTGWEVHYCKLDPQGNIVIDWSVITTGADCWNWLVQPLVTSDDRILVTWIRDTSDICAISSADYGVTWSDIIVLLPNAGGGDQASAGKAVIGNDDSLHFVWRTLNWTTYDEYLWYAKVRPDWSIAVDETIFYEGAGWYPYPCVDDQDGIHVTFAPLYDVATDMYYTRLRGDLDLDGASASDEMLTAIPERLFYSDPDFVHYPVNQVDHTGTVHVVYEEGTYGRLTDKDLYYVALCSLDGDLNCSGTVDIGDLPMFEGVMAGPNGPAPAGSDPTDFVNADLDEDGDVDLADFTRFQDLFGSSEDD